MSLYEEALLLTSRMSLTEKVRLLEYLSHSVRETLETEAYRRMPWNEFIDRTYGILADDPIERPPQGDFEVRDPIE